MSPAQLEKQDKVWDIYGYFVDQARSRAMSPAEIWDKYGYFVDHARSRAMSPAQPEEQDLLSPKPGYATYWPRARATGSKTSHLKLICS